VTVAQKGFSVHETPPRITVAIVNQKGGVGKTTTAVHLAHGLALLGAARILAVDLDPQGNLTTWIGADDPPAKTIADVLSHPREALEAIGASRLAGVDLLYGSRESALAERELQTTAAPATALRRVLRAVETQYDAVIVDCPPALGLLAINAIVAADELIVPVEAATMALAGLSQVRATVAELVDAEVCEHPPRVRILVTRYDGRLGLARDVLDHLRGSDDVDLYSTVIRSSTKIAESFGHGQTALTYAPRSPGAIDYASFAKEFAR
jgi:chromosome partitioning protein